VEHLGKVRGSGGEKKEVNKGWWVRVGMDLMDQGMEEGKAW
jgi:hypothetical protein